MLALNINEFAFRFKHFISFGQFKLIGLCLINQILDSQMHKRTNNISIHLINWILIPS